MSYKQKIDSLGSQKILLSWLKVHVDFFVNYILINGFFYFEIFHVVKGYSNVLWVQKQSVLKGFCFIWTLSRMFYVYGPLTSMVA